MAKVNSGKRHNQKFGLDRRQGINLWGRAKSPINKRKYPQGQHGPTLRRKQTDYGKQLHAKQRIKGYYANISEKRFRRYYDDAVRKAGDTIANFIGGLEARLDAVVYRAKFTPSVFGARQLVSHGHVLVNGKKVTIPSYSVKPGDVVSLKDKSQNISMVLEGMASNERDFCDYVDVDVKKFTATFTRMPAFEEVPYPVEMDPQLVIEFYSRQ
ncbi:MAG: 30S ribosomal protein S4 [Alphaproteobacteria bacterium]|nr:30S ribosomal protein S4 [Alphaproteobacteria bacterium]MBN2779479.1 30S ribosomal protein S4 [Alphaproteobacteria bacterium]